MASSGDEKQTPLEFQTERDIQLAANRCLRQKATFKQESFWQKHLFCQSQSLKLARNNNTWH